MSWIKEKKLNEEIESLVAKAGELLTFAQKEERDLSAEETAEFGKLHDDADKRREELELFKRQDKAQSATAKFSVQESGNDVATFNSELKKMANFALSSGTSTSGAELMQKLVPSIWDVKLRGSAPIFDCGFKQYSVDVSGTYPIPVFNGTGNSGSLVTEGNAVSPADPATDGVICQDYRYSAATVASRQTIQSASSNLAQFLEDDFNDQIVYQFSKRGLVTGNGTNSPTALMAVAGEGKEATAPTAITIAELMDTKYSLNSRYHTGGMWMMHGKTWGTIVQLIQAASVANAVSIVQGLEKFLDGDRVIINDEMDQIAATKKVVLYFNPRYGHIKEVTPLTNLIVDGLTLGYNDQVRFIQHRYLGFCFTNADAAKYLITDAD